MEKVRTVVVGCGMISNIYIKNLKSLFSIIDLIAVSDLDRAKAEEKAGTWNIRRVMTVDEVASSPEIEMVINLTPAFAHYGVIKKMLEAGKHVWTEKVMTVTLDEARELCALADRKGLYLGVAPDTVLGAGVQTARRALDTGMIGEVTSGIAVINRDQSLNAEVFTFLRGKGGSLPYDVGIYYIGALCSAYWGRCGPSRPSERRRRCTNPDSFSATRGKRRGRFPAAACFPHPCALAAARW